MSNEPRAEKGYGQLYRDTWGQIWKRVDADYVWKPDTGFGVWNNGTGLELL